MIDYTLTFLDSTKENIPKLSIRPGQYSKIRSRNFIKDLLPRGHLKDTVPTELAVFLFFPIHMKAARPSALLGIGVVT
ncbi:hypothetical protein AKJ16_DCAP19534 [Drosera capensis]